MPMPAYALSEGNRNRLALGRKSLTVHHCLLLSVPCRYPNVPQQMWTDKAGNLLNMSSTWLSKGFGIPRQNCWLQEAWDCWVCPFANYSRLILESMDPDHNIRRISPVALSVSFLKAFQRIKFAIPVLLSVSALWCPMQSITCDDAISSA